MSGPTDPIPERTDVIAEVIARGVGYSDLGIDWRKLAGEVIAADLSWVLRYGQEAKRRLDARLDAEAGR
jgi:hypothetical protein